MLQKTNNAIKIHYRAKLNSYRGVGCLKQFLNLIRKIRFHSKNHLHSNDAVEIHVPYN